MLPHWGERTTMEFGVSLQCKKATRWSPLTANSCGFSGLNLIQVRRSVVSVFPSVPLFLLSTKRRDWIGPSRLSSDQSQMLTVWGESAPRVAIYLSSADKSRVQIPFGCGFKKVLTGVPEKESQTTSMESSPESAVTSHRRWGLSEQAIAVI